MISKWFHWKVWYVITYPFPNFSGWTVEVWEWNSNLIPHFNGHVVTNQCWDLSQTMSAKGALGHRWVNYIPQVYVDVITYPIAKSDRSLFAKSCRPINRSCTTENHTLCTLQIMHVWSESKQFYIQRCNVSKNHFILLKHISLLIKRNKNINLHNFYQICSLQHINAFCPRKIPGTFQ